MSLEIKVSRIHRFENEEGNLRAFADIEVNDSLLIKGLHIFSGSKGLSVAMPREKGKNNKWYETVRTLSPEVKEKIMAVVLEAYRNNDGI